MKPDMVRAAYAAFFFVVYPVGVGALVVYPVGGALGLLVWAFVVLVFALAGRAHGRRA